MNRKLTKSPLSLTLPDEIQIKSKHTAMISLPNLPEAARHAHILSELKSGALLSVSQLCDQVYRFKFTTYQVSFTLDNQTILVVPCDTNKGLWTVPLDTLSLPQPKPWVPPPIMCQYTHAIPTVQPPTIVHQADNNAFATKNKQELVMYLHVEFFSSLVSKLVKAINTGNFAYCSRLAADLVTNRIPNSQATVKGHIQQQQQQIEFYQKATAKSN